MERVQSLADFLGAEDPLPEEKRPKTDYETLLDISDPMTFCRRIMETREFRQYIMDGFRAGDIPAAIVGRIMDHVLGKPPERVEHTGKDGAPIITEVRRVIVRAESQEDEQSPRREVTH